MHPDLERLWRLSDLDAELDHAMAALAAARGAVEAGHTAVKAAEGDRAARAAERAGLQEAERAVSRELEQYRVRLARAEKALAEGLGAPEAAERQRVQCLDIIDRLETQMLEALEALDAQAPALAAADRALSDAKASLVAAEAEAPTRSAEALAEARRIKALRDAQYTPLPKELQSRYDVLAAQKPPAVARIDKGTCLKCLSTVHAQALADLNQDRIVACRGCGRWLIQG